MEVFPETTADAVGILFEEREGDDDEETLAVLTLGQGPDLGTEDAPEDVLILETEADPDDEAKSLRWDDELSDSLESRDARIADFDREASHQKIRERLRQTGTAEDIQDALAELGEREVDTTATKGVTLDMRHVVRRLAGDTTVDDYYRRRVQRAGDELAVGVSLDMSGSMSGDELEAKAAVGAFLFGVQQAGGDVVANAWRSRAPTVFMLTGPYEQFRWEHLDAVVPGGGDPIAIGMVECARMLDQVRPQERLLFVITDGNPGVTSYRDDEFSSAIKEAAATVEELRGHGLTIVGLGFGSASERNLVRIFGEEFAYDVGDVEALADTLVDAFEDHHPDVDGAP